MAINEVDEAKRQSWQLSEIHCSNMSAKRVPLSQAHAPLYLGCIILAKLARARLSESYNFSNLQTLLSELTFTLSQVSVKKN